MPREFARPTPGTVRKLYGNAVRCAHPECNRPLYKVDERTGARSLDSHVSHIHARSENGPRWDPDMTEAANRGFDNLLVLCMTHAYEVDDENREGEFTADILRAWKSRQLAEHDRLGGGIKLTDEEVTTAIAEAQASIVNIEQHNVHGNNYAAGTMNFYATEAQPEAQYTVLQRNEPVDGDTNGFVTTFGVRLTLAYAVERIRLLGTTTKDMTTISGGVRTAQGQPLGLGGSPLFAGVDTGLMIEFDRPPRQFMFDVITPEPDAVGFNCVFL